MSKGLEALKILEEHFNKMNKEDLVDLERRAVACYNKIITKHDTFELSNQIILTINK